MLDVIGKLYNDDGTYDDDGTVLTLPTEKEGYFVNATLDYLFIADYKVSSPVTPTRVFSGTETYFYLFPDQETFESFLTDSDTPELIDDRVANPDAIPYGVTSMSVPEFKAWLGHKRRVICLTLSEGTTEHPKDFAVIDFMEMLSEHETVRSDHPDLKVALDYLDTIPGFKEGEDSTFDLFLKEAA